MKKNILIPTDFSENAWNAITYVLDLYKDFECNIYFLNTYNFPGYLYESQFVTNPSPEVYREYRLHSENRIKETIKTVELHFDNKLHKYHSVSEHNSLFNAIKGFLTKQKIDLIVMGTKGENSNLDIIYGSNAVDIMENIQECPVLVIPKMENRKKLEEIIFLTDYNEIDDYKKLDILIEISKSNNAPICVLYIKKEDRFSDLQLANKSKLESYLSSTSFISKAISNNGIFEALDCFVQSRESDMVSFFSHPKSVFQNIFNKPLVKKVGSHSKVPSIVMH